MASITHGRSLSALRSWFMASLGQSPPLDMIRWSRTSSPNSDMPRILAEGHCLRASRSTHVLGFIVVKGIADSGKGCVDG